MFIKKKYIWGVAGLVVILAVAIYIFPKQAEANVFQDIWGSLKSQFEVFNNSPSDNSSSVEEEIGKTEPVVLYKPAVDYENAVIAAVEKASPAVVSIVVTKDLPIIEQCPYDPFSDIPSELKQYFNLQGGSSFSRPCNNGKTERKEVGGGTGFIVDAGGLVITNKHVVFDEKASYTVLTNDGKKYDAKVLARDPNIDLAVVKIDAGGLPVLNLGNSDSVKLGQTAITIGNALGEFRNTVSVGVISGLARTITASGEGFGAEKIEGVLQTDAAINPGNSGGPLLNLKGEVIGINTAMAQGAQSVGFALPINMVKKSIDSVKTNGKIVTPYLGVRYLMITDDLAVKEKLSVKSGALIRGGDDGPAVVPESPAEKAGILAEDIITVVNGEEIKDGNSLVALLMKHSAGEKVKLKIMRKGKEMEVEAVLGER